MKIYRGFCNRQLIADSLVAVPVPNQPEHFQFASREIFFAQMFGKFFAATQEEQVGGRRARSG